VGPQFFYPRILDTAANDAALAALEHTSLPVAAKTLCGSAAAVLARALIVPVDAWQTQLRALGVTLIGSPVAGVRTRVLGVTLIGQYPFFFTNNQLRECLPSFDFACGEHARNGAIGLCSGMIANLCTTSGQLLRGPQMDVERSFKNILRTEPAIRRMYFNQCLIMSIRGATFTIAWQALVARQCDC